jgi:hypothetical protein
VSESISPESGADGPVPKPALPQLVVPGEFVKASCMNAPTADVVVVVELVGVVVVELVVDVVALVVDVVALVVDVVALVVDVVALVVDVVALVVDVVVAPVVDVVDDDVVVVGTSDAQEIVTFFPAESS